MSLSALGIISDSFYDAVFFAKLKLNAYEGY